MKANGQAIAAEQEQKGEKTKRYTPSMQQRAEQAARLREEASRQAQEERARLQKQRPPRAPIQPPVSEKPAAVPGSFCPQCGKKVDPIDQYCLHCGCRLRGPGKEGEKEQKATVNPERNIEKTAKMTGYDNFLTKALTFAAGAVIIKLLKK